MDVYMALATAPSYPRPAFLIEADRVTARPVPAVTAPIVPGAYSGALSGRLNDYSLGVSRNGARYVAAQITVIRHFKNFPY